RAAGRSKSNNCKPPLAESRNRGSNRQLSSAAGHSRSGNHQLPRAGQAAIHSNSINGHRGSKSNEHNNRSRGDRDGDRIDRRHRVSSKSSNCKPPRAMSRNGGSNRQPSSAAGRSRSRELPRAGGRSRSCHRKPWSVAGRTRSSNRQPPRAAGECFEHAGQVIPPAWKPILVKIFATALALSQEATTPDAVKTQFDPVPDQEQVAQLLHAGCAHMRKAFDIEDINLEDPIATALDDPQAVDENTVFRGINFADLQMAYRELCKNEKIVVLVVDLGDVIDFYNKAAAELPDHVTRSSPGLRCTNLCN